MEPRTKGRAAKDPSANLGVVDETQRQSTTRSTACNTCSGQSLITSGKTIEWVNSTNGIYWRNTTATLHRIISPGLTTFGLEAGLSTVSKLIVSGQRVRDSIESLVLTTLN